MPNPLVTRRPDGSFQFNDSPDPHEPAPVRKAREKAVRRLNREAARIRYAHPLSVPENRAWYVPGGRGYIRDREPSADYIPGGLSLAGDFHQGGEALSEADLADLAEAGVLGDVLPLLHHDRDRALADWLSKNNAPGKDIDPRTIGRPQGAARSQQLPYPDRRLQPNAAGKERPVGLNQTPKTPAEGRANLPGDIGRHVSDDEAMQITPAQAQNFVSLFNDSAPVGDFAAGAKMGQAKRGWYKNASQAILSLFGADAPRFASLLAATSPVKGVGENLNNALLIWRAYNDLRKEHGREPSREEVTAWVRDGRLVEALGDDGYAMKTEFPNIIRALTKPFPGRAGTLSGPKVDSFAGNLLGQLHRATNDTWMAAFAGVRHGDLAGRSRKDDYGTQQVFGGGYAAISAKIRSAAELLNSQLAPGEAPWTPAEVQETTWSVFRALADAMGQTRQQTRKDKKAPALEKAARVPDAAQALNALTHERVHGNADFASLLVQAHEQGSALGEALDALGFGDALAKLARVNARSKKGGETLPRRAVESLDPGEYEAALRVARRAAQASPRFDNAMVEYARRAERRRFERMRAAQHPSGNALVRQAGPGCDWLQGRARGTRPQPRPKPQRPQPRRLRREDGSLDIDAYRELVG